MLVISRAQREKSGEPAFIDRLVDHLKRYHIEDVHMLPDPVLRRRVVHGLEKGRTYGLTWEYSLTVFVAHMIRINPEFDKQRAIQRVLRDESIEADRRVDALAAEVTNEEWEECLSQCDAEAYWRNIGAPTPTRGAIDERG